MSDGYFSPASAASALPPGWVRTPADGVYLPASRFHPALPPSTAVTGSSLASAPTASAAAPAVDVTARRARPQSSVAHRAWSVQSKVIQPSSSSSNDNANDDAATRASVGGAGTARLQRPMTAKQARNRFAQAEAVNAASTAAAAAAAALPGGPPEPPLPRFALPGPGSELLAVFPHARDASSVLSNSSSAAARARRTSASAAAFTMHAPGCHSQLCEGVAAGARGCHSAWVAEQEAAAARAAAAAEAERRDALDGYFGNNKTQQLYEEDMLTARRAQLQQQQQQQQAQLQSGGDEHSVPTGATLAPKGLWASSSAAAAAAAAANSNNNALAGSRPSSAAVSVPAEGVTATGATVGPRRPGLRPHAPGSAAAATAAAGVPVVQPGFAGFADDDDGAATVVRQHSRHGAQRAAAAAAARASVAEAAEALRGGVARQQRPQTARPASATATAAAAESSFLRSAAAAAAATTAYDGHSSPPGQRRRGGFFAHGRDDNNLDNDDADGVGHEASEIAGPHEGLWLHAKSVTGHSFFTHTAANNNINSDTATAGPDGDYIDPADVSSHVHAASAAAAVAGNPLSATSYHGLPPAAALGRFAKQLAAVRRREETARRDALATVGGNRNKVMQRPGTASAHSASRSNSSGHGGSVGAVPEPLRPASLWPGAPALHTITDNGAGASAGAGAGAGAAAVGSGAGLMTGPAAVDRARAIAASTVAQSQSQSPALNDGYESRMHGARVLEGIIDVGSLQLNSNEAGPQSESRLDYGYGRLPHGHPLARLNFGLLGKADQYTLAPESTNHADGNNMNPVGNVDGPEAAAFGDRSILPADMAAALSRYDNVPLPFNTANTADTDTANANANGIVGVAISGSGTGDRNARLRRPGTAHPASRSAHGQSAAHGHSTAHGQATGYSAAALGAAPHRLGNRPTTAGISHLSYLANSNNPDASIPTKRITPAGVVSSSSNNSTAAEATTTAADDDAAAWESYNNYTISTARARQLRPGAHEVLANPLVYGVLAATSADATAGSANTGGLSAAVASIGGSAGVGMPAALKAAALGRSGGAAAEAVAARRLVERRRAAALHKRVTETRRRTGSVMAAARGRMRAQLEALERANEVSVDGVVLTWRERRAIGLGVRELRLPAGAIEHVQQQLQLQYHGHGSHGDHSEDGGADAGDGSKMHQQHQQQVSAASTRVRPHSAYPALSAAHSGTDARYTDGYGPGKVYGAGDSAPVKGAMMEVRLSPQVLTAGSSANKQSQMQTRPHTATATIAPTAAAAKTAASAHPVASGVVESTAVGSQEEGSSVAATVNNEDDDDGQNNSGEPAAATNAGSDAATAGDATTETPGARYSVNSRSNAPQRPVLTQLGSARRARFGPPAIYDPNDAQMTGAHDAAADAGSDSAPVVPAGSYPLPPHALAAPSRAAAHAYQRAASASAAAAASRSRAFAAATQPGAGMSSGGDALGGDEGNGDNSIGHIRAPLTALEGFSSTSNHGHGIGTVAGFHADASSSRPSTAGSRSRAHGPWQPPVRRGPTIRGARDAPTLTLALRSQRVVVTDDANESLYGDDHTAHASAAAGSGQVSDGGLALTASAAEAAAEAAAAAHAAAALAAGGGMSLLRARMAAEAAAAAARRAGHVARVAMTASGPVSIPVAHGHCHVDVDGDGGAGNGQLSDSAAGLSSSAAAAHSAAHGAAASASVNGSRAFTRIGLQLVPTGAVAGPLAPPDRGLKPVAGGGVRAGARPASAAPVRLLPRANNAGAKNTLNDGTDANADEVAVIAQSSDAAVDPNASANAYPVAVADGATLGSKMTHAPQSSSLSATVTVAGAGTGAGAMAHRPRPTTAFARAGYALALGAAADGDDLSAGVRAPAVVDLVQAIPVTHNTNTIPHSVVSYRPRPATAAALRSQSASRGGHGQANAQPHDPNRPGNPYDELHGRSSAYGMRTRGHASAGSCNDDAGSGDHSSAEPSLYAGRGAWVPSALLKAQQTSAHANAAAPVKRPVDGVVAITSSGIGNGAAAVPPQHEHGGSHDGGAKTPSKRGAKTPRSNSVRVPAREGVLLMDPAYAGAVNAGGMGLNGAASGGLSARALADPSERGIQMPMFHATKFDFDRKALYNHPQE